MPTAAAAARSPTWIFIPELFMIYSARKKTLKIIRKNLENKIKKIRKNIYKSFEKIKIK